MRHCDPFKPIALGNEFTLSPAVMNVPPDPEPEPNREVQESSNRADRFNVIPFHRPANFRGEPHLNNHRGEIIPFPAWPSDHYSVLALRDRLRRIG